MKPDNYTKTLANAVVRFANSNYFRPVYVDENDGVWWSQYGMEWNKLTMFKGDVVTFKDSDKVIRF